MEAYYHHQVVQRGSYGLIGSTKRDKLFIRLQLYKTTGWRRVRSSDPIWETNTMIAQKDFRLMFSPFKRQLCENNDSNREYETLISKHLNNMGVPENEHPLIVQRIFVVVKAAVSPVDPVVVLVSDVTLSIRDEPFPPWSASWVPASSGSWVPVPVSNGSRISATRSRIPASISSIPAHDPATRSWIPASRSSIHALKPVTVIDTSHSTCAICLYDFEVKPITRLPCTHHFHVDCIVQWLQINHLCPCCRYPMPTQEDQLTPGDHSIWSSLSSLFEALFT